MSAIRPAAVAGSFYPGDASSLATEVATYLAEAHAPLLGAPAHAALLGAPAHAPLPGAPAHAPLLGAPAPPGPNGARGPKAIIAPHAGYMYSGPVAGRVYARLAPLRGVVTRVILAGPAHRVFVRGAAVPASQAFASPLGTVPIDLETVARLRKLAFVEVSDRAHALEHSLEVHLPFLQSVLGKFSIVPLVVGDAGPAEMAELYDVVWGQRETLIVVSSDLSHYLPYESARSRDRDTADAILNLEARLVPEEACGAAPINGLLRAARRHGMASELIDLRSSGDTAGSRDRVVGYGAFAFHEPEKSGA